MQLLFENPHCRIFLDDTVPALVQVWDGFVTGEPLRDAHEATLRLLQTHQLGRILADTRAMRVIPRADQQWITEHFLPRALAAGFRRSAILVAEDAFNRTSIQNILAQITPEEVFEARHFHDTEEARQWLRLG
ncbi:STAS/SEC14 domain-containing protein [Hymenobacter perfusus]|uniref:STAS/SEC14 domain-containing protein n=1 Tax=Hymenobacter perfusus TaxID=1236770 RepID=A0A3R9PLB7_9BACT|nr:STAS/SEC14 domain-containing protein [Hymenobacter perfusus]RSK40915.1 hypothetical protein EI293_18410 [Hymenobacter perfusus]